MRPMSFACGRMAGKSLRALRREAFAFYRCSPKCVVADPSSFAKWTETCASFCV